MRVDVPPGWDGEIYPAATPEGALAAAGEPRAVVHLATFPLPPQRGDFGSEAAAAMRPGDVMVMLFEYERSSAAQPLFDHQGMPTLAPGDFSDRTMPRRRLGIVGAQRFFATAGRAFCLHVLLGAGGADAALVRVANDIAASIAIS